MSESILNSTKKILGMTEDYKAFDPDVTLYINAVFSTLQQLGIGPQGGYQISGADEIWVDFLGGDPRLNSVKTYVYLRVRLLFDPPTSSFALTSMQEQVKELEWRLTVTRESEEGMY